MGIGPLAVWQGLCCRPTLVGDFAGTHCTKHSRKRLGAEPWLVGGAGNSGEFQHSAIHSLQLEVATAASSVARLACSCAILSSPSPR